MVSGSPSVMPAPSPLPRPAKNISTVDPTNADATAVSSQRHRDTAPASTASPSPDSSSLYTRRTAADDVRGGGSREELRHRGVDAVSALRREHPLPAAGLSFAASSSDLVIEPNAKPARNNPTDQPIV